MYIVCTAFGVIFYMLLPDMVNLFGANISRALVYYAGLAAYYGDVSSEIGRIYFAAGAAFWVLQLVLLIFALIKKRNLLLFTVVLSDILLTGAFVLWKGLDPLVIGLLNLVYCAWLGWSIFQKFKNPAQ